MPEDAEPRSFERLSREESLALVATLEIGRVAVCQPGEAPLVVPVNYVLDGEVVVFRTDPGTKLAALVTGQPVSFQVDLVDPFHRSGWSVLITGTAFEATHWEVDHLTVEPWAGGDKSHWVRLEPRTVTGRRVQFVAPSEGDVPGYL